jgi:hypothetical protein
MNFILWTIGAEIEFQSGGGGESSPGAGGNYSAPARASAAQGGCSGVFWRNL